MSITGGAKALSGLNRHGLNYIGYTWGSQSTDFDCRVEGDSFFHHHYTIGVQ